MKEYTEIQILSSDYNFSEEEDVILKFGKKYPKEILYACFSGISGDILILETQSFYEGVPLKMNNKNSKLSVYKDRNIKICDAIVILKYYKPATSQTWKYIKEIDLKKSIMFM